MARVHVILTNGVEGPSCYINNYRIVGSKSWGGGQLMLSARADLGEILTALGLGALLGGLPDGAGACNCLECEQLAKAEDREEDHG